MLDAMAVLPKGGSMVRLVSLLGLIIVGVLFALQNQTSTIALTFLGMQTLALPLAWWVLGAIGLGSATTLAVSALFGLSSFVTRQAVRSQVRRTSRAEEPSSTSTSRSNSRSTSNDDSLWQDWRGYENSSASRTDSRADSRADSQFDPPRNSSSNRVTSEPIDDWQQPISDDWEDTPPFRQPDEFAPQSSPPRTVPPRTDFEASQTPYRSNRSGSAYSYRYREPDAPPPVNPNKAVVDADYRVLVPPHRPLDEPPHPPTPPQSENADDWFGEDTNDRDRRGDNR
jgi:uncharacterized integral membrane protein